MLEVLIGAQQRLCSGSGAIGISSEAWRASEEVPETMERPEGESGLSKY
jgi:hypothetical protein